MNNGSSYYGGFYWIAAVSFIVPLFVAWSAFQDLRPATKPQPNPDVSGVDHNLFDYLLRTYVENGLVDYHGISRDYLFPMYLQQLAGAKPELLETDDERLALHCNAYNALVINGVIIHGIHNNEKNVLQYDPGDGTDFFDLQEHIFAGETMSLNHLEHQVIRPTFQDPRIHVALVCAARSCPSIRPEAYNGDRLQQQLDDQTQLFANNPDYVAWDAQLATIKLSPILKWYGTDWDAQGGYLGWLEQHVQSEALRAKLQDAESGSVPVAFNRYDWSLNATSGGYSSAAGGGASFGSGSVPNE